MGGDPTDLHPGALRWLTGRCGRRERPEVAPVPPPPPPRPWARLPRRLLPHRPPTAGMVVARSWGGAEGGPRPTAAAGPEARAQRPARLTVRQRRSPGSACAAGDAGGGSSGRSVRGGRGLSPVPEHHDIKQQSHLYVCLLVP